MAPPILVTEDRVRLMIKQEMEPYHQQNLEKFDRLTSAFNRFQGAIWAVGTIVAGIEIYFKIKGL